jgi:SNF2 family DNA or RNA helicase
VQLFPLLAAIDHPLGRDQLSFEQTYCQGHWRDSGGRRHWQANGAERLEELHRLIQPLLLHRRKQDCLDLPPKWRLHCPVELDGSEALGFERELQQRVEQYRLRAARGEVRRDAESLAMLTALRQIGAAYKLPAAQVLVSELLASGASVVVFTAFVAPAERLAENLGGALLTEIGRAHV